MMGLVEENLRGGSIAFSVRLSISSPKSKVALFNLAYDAGFWKLRQISLGYDFTKFIPGKWPIKGVKLDFVAYNVLIIKKWVDNIDPESFGYSSDNLVGLESTGIPTTRGIGFNLNVKF